jgi:hypothetical protein
LGVGALRFWVLGVGALRFWVLSVDNKHFNPQLFFFTK